MLYLSTIDSIWRCVIGVGAFPALIAILYRITIPESPRYTNDINRDGKSALLDIRRHLGKAPNQPTGLAAGTAAAQVSDQAAAQTSNLAVGQTADPAAAQTDGPDAAQPGNPAAETTEADELTQILIQNPNANDATTERPKYFTWPKIKEFLWTEGNWRYLFATSMCWFLLDFAFYGLGINNPRQLAAIWAGTSPNFSTNLTDWRDSTSLSNCIPDANMQSLNFTTNITHPHDWENPFDGNITMYQELNDNAMQYIATISSGSLAGSILLLMAINRIRRKAWLMLSFWVLAGLFAITAGTLRLVGFTPSHWATVVFYAICQFLFNLGEFVES
jgi:MFS transporter, PHS family, inorganic phosphate transporter